MKALLALLLLSTTAIAQTLKWEAIFPELPAGVTSAQEWSGLLHDGTGGCAVLLRLVKDGSTHGYRVIWINRRGVLRTIELGPAESGPLHRVTRNALYLGAGPNMRKYRWKAKEIEFASTVPLSTTELQGFVIENAAQRQDNLGFFTYLYDDSSQLRGVRRFGN